MEYKILNQEGVVVSTHKDIKEAEARVEMFKQLLPNATFTITQEGAEAVEVPASADPVVETQPVEQPSDQTIEEALNNMDVSNDDDQGDEKHYYIVKKENGAIHGEFYNYEVAKDFFLERKLSNDEYAIVEVEKYNKAEAVEIDGSYKRPINNYYVESQDGVVVAGPFDFDHQNEAEKIREEMEKTHGRNYFVRVEHLGFEKSIDEIKQEQESKKERPKNYRLQIEKEGSAQVLEFGEKRDIERYMNKNGDDIIKAFYWNIRKPDEITTIKEPTNSQETQENVPNLNETPWDNTNTPMPTKEDLINILNDNVKIEADDAGIIKVDNMEVIVKGKTNQELIGGLVIELFNLLKKGGN